MGRILTEQEKERRINLKSKTNQGYIIKIVEYDKSESILVEFENGYKKKTTYDAFLKGGVKTPFHKTMFRIGFFGDGVYKAQTKVYQTWQGMFIRCYCPKTLKESPTYIGCSVHPDWHNFQNFAKWYEENFDPVKHKGFQLDKDLLVPGNKVYGPDTCCFVPGELNTLLTKQNIKRKSNLPTGVREVKIKTTGKFRYEVQIYEKNKQLYLGTYDTVEEASLVYKTKKEEQIKNFAEKWKHLIKEELYNVLLNTKI